VAVLIEAISVVVRLSDVKEKYPGGWEQFVRDTPQDMLCADSHVARVGFLEMAEAQAFVNSLTTHGLAFQTDGHSADIAVVDQATGPTTPVDWLEFGIVPFLDGAVTVARMVGDSENMLMTPDGWKFERSLSRAAGLTPDDVQ
jgi:hypothetical protein